MKNDKRKEFFVIFIGGIIFSILYMVAVCFLMSLAYR